MYFNFVTRLFYNFLLVINGIAFLRLYFLFPTTRGLENLSKGEIIASLTQTDPFLDLLLILFVKRAVNFYFLFVCFYIRKNQFRYITKLCRFVIIKSGNFYSNIEGPKAKELHNAQNGNVSVCSPFERVSF